MNAMNNFNRPPATPEHSELKKVSELNVGDLLTEYNARISEIGFAGGLRKLIKLDNGTTLPPQDYDEEFKVG